MWSLAARQLSRTQMCVNKAKANKPYFCFLVEIPRETESCGTDGTPGSAKQTSFCLLCLITYKASILCTQVEQGCVCRIRSYPEPSETLGECPGLTRSSHQAFHPPCQCRACRLPQHHNRHMELIALPASPPSPQTADIAIALPGHFPCCSAVCFFCCGK